jgi:hypothetical protein
MLHLIPLAGVLLRLRNMPACEGLPPYETPIGA